MLYDNNNNNNTNQIEPKFILRYLSINKASTRNQSNDNEQTRTTFLLLSMCVALVAYGQNTEKSRNAIVNVCMEVAHSVAYVRKIQFSIAVKVVLFIIALLINDRRKLATPM